MNNLNNISESLHGVSGTIEPFIGGCFEAEEKYNKNEKV